MSSEQQARLEETLTQWWLDAAHEEISRTVPKAVEYGADDLGEIGRQLAAAAGLRSRTVAPGEFVELGIYFYVIGKVARWTAAIREGRQVSDDTLFDIGVYIRMAQKNRDGGWPG